MRTQFPRQFHMLSPVVIPTIQLPEIVHLAGITPHEERATRNPNQFSVIYRVLLYHHPRLVFLRSSPGQSHRETVTHF